MKAYKLEYLFVNRWDQLSPKVMAEVVALVYQAKDYFTREMYREYGVCVISTLRLLRRRPLLVDKIDEAQATDCFNALTFLHEPWYQFHVSRLTSHAAPEEYLHNRTFDHFIYADKEFSLYQVTQKDDYLFRLAATLYGNEKYFNEDAIDQRALEIKKATASDRWKLSLIFYTYAHIRTFIFKRCTHLFDLSSGGNGKLEPTGPVWLKWKHMLAETPAFQGMETAGRAPLYKAMDYLNDLAERKKHAAAHNP